MTDKLVIEKCDEVLIKVHCDAGVAMELSDYFTFSVPGAKFTPMFRNKMWDGKIRLFHAMARTIYVGLRYHVEQFAKERGYECEYMNAEDFLEESFSIKEAEEFVKTLEGLPHQPRDYQLSAFAHAVRTRRALLLSPTASGKSLIIYLICRYLFNNDKTLVIVPTTSLVHQMASDFVSYGCNPNWIHKIHSGEDKDTKRPFVITTWQSVYKLPKPWYRQFNTIIGDEAHLFKAKSLTSIMSKLDKCPNKFGFTGTLDGTQTNKLVLEGLFGPVKKVTTTAELIEQKHLSAFKIKAIVLKHDDEVCQRLKSATYADELAFITGNTARNAFISNLVASLKGNTLILFKTRDHGDELFKRVKDSVQHEDVFYVDGTVDGLIREDIRTAVETKESAVIVASLGTFSTGVNIRNLHNIIFASPSKSRVKTLQSIGRGLRKSETKTEATLYDIADDITWKSHKNFTIQHFMERVKMYNEEMFEYKIYNVKLKG